MGGEMMIPFKNILENNVLSNSTYRVSKIPIENPAIEQLSLMNRIAKRLSLMIFFIKPQIMEFSLPLPPTTTFRDDM